MSFPKDLSLGLKCYMFGTCQKLAFWHKLDNQLLPICFKVKKKFCLSKKNTDSILFPSAQAWLKEEEHWTAELHYENYDRWRISSNHLAISGHFTNKVSFFIAPQMRWGEQSLSHTIGGH